MQQQEFPNKENTYKVFSKINNQVKPIFALCEKCYWCATILDTSTIIGGCPGCSGNDLTSFPIRPDEIFTFGYGEER